MKLASPQKIELVLASGSVYRSAALRRSGLDHQTWPPELDESPHKNEPPDQLALRLSAGKALAGARKFPESLVVGSDQTGECRNRLLTKPGDKTTNIDQLLYCSGESAVFHTGLAVYVPSRASLITLIVTTALQFRALSRQDVERYVNLDQAFDCAGGFKIESAGLTLFESVSSDDPSALVGLPLIALAKILRSLDFPSHSSA